MWRVFGQSRRLYQRGGVYLFFIIIIISFFLSFVENERKKRTKRKWASYMPGCTSHTSVLTLGILGGMIYLFLFSRQNKSASHSAGHIKTVSEDGKNSFEMSHMAIFSIQQSVKRDRLLFLAPDLQLGVLLIQQLIRPDCQYQVSERYVTMMRRHISKQDRRKMLHSKRPSGDVSSSSLKRWPYYY